MTIPITIQPTRGRANAFLDAEEAQAAVELLERENGNARWSFDVERGPYWYHVRRLMEGRADGYVYSARLPNHSGLL